MSVISSRTISAFPVSIGTSLVLESIADGPGEPYDKERKVPDRVSLGEYDTWLVNVDTLLRNLLSATTDKIPTREYRDIGPTVIDEMNVIWEVATGVSSTINVIFYKVRYEDVYRRLKEPVRPRIPTTDKQALFREQMTAGWKGILDSGWANNIKTFPTKISLPGSRNTLITTSYPWDLLSVKFLKNLDLLESHTGVLKKSVAFNSKYHRMGNHRWHNLPWDEKLLYFLGDSVMFSPAPVTMRRILKGVSEERGWTPTMSRLKLEREIKSYCGKDVADLFSRYPRFL